MVEVEVIAGDPATYKVDPAQRTWGNDKCCAFTEVTHTTHVLPAVEVLRSGRLAAGLVYDRSCLNEHRVAVVWMSPNHWTPGYRYGNVQFTFSFNELVQGRRAYWVEVAKYSPHAARILLTDQDRDHCLARYDCTSGSGPWWFDGTTHHFNNTVCVEFMVEGELPKWSRMKFVDHSPRFCCMHRTEPKKCRELGTKSIDGACRFLARLAIEGIDVLDLPFDDRDLSTWCGRLMLKTAKNSTSIYTGSMKGTDPGADAVARALLAAHATYHEEQDRDALLGLFASQEDAQAACLRVLAAALGRTEDLITKGW